jgi:glycosyltransferase involved in cell wall biosynthesis
VSVIICAYTTQRWADLVASVASVQAQALPALETIVVIDRSAELLRRAAAELNGVIVVANRDGGLSGSRQTGAQHAHGEVLAFLDDDAIADQGWLAGLVPAYEDPLVLGAGGSVEPWWLQRQPRWFPREFDWVVGCSHPGLPQQTGRVRNVIGANMSVRAEVLRRAGSFELKLSRTYTDGGAGSTADDTEFCIRASRLHPGGTWLYVPEARVRHRIPPARATFRYFVRRCRMEGRAKAVIAELEGDSVALEAERTYVRSLLFAAVVRELRQVGGGRLDSLARAFVIAAGLSVTAFAYVGARMRQRLASITATTRPPTAFMDAPPS